MKIGRIVWTHLACLTLMAAAGANVATPPLKKTVAAAAPVVDKPVTGIASQPTYRRYVHPQAKAMAGIDLARMAASPLGKRLASQIEGLGIKQKAAAEGLDFVSEIEKLVFSSPGEPTELKGRSTLSEEAPFLVAMQGKFKIDKLRKSLSSRKATRMIHQGAEVWFPAKGDTSIAIVNSQVMLLGDRKSLRETLDAQAEEGAEPAEIETNSIHGRAAELAKAYDFWFLSEASLAGLSGSPIPQADMLKGIDQFELGVSFRKGLDADINLRGSTDEDANGLGTMLAGIKAMMALSVQNQKEPELSAMLNKLKIGTSGNRVMISVRFNQAELDRGFDTVLAQRMGGKAPKAPASSPAAAGSATPATPEIPKAPPAPLMVRIFNADGGTREIPLSR
jgi:hypothetical protein